MNDDAKNARADAHTVETVEEFSRWAEKLEGRSLLYRGLADATWELESAAYRRIKEQEGTPKIPGVFKNYVSQLLDTARMRGFRMHEGRTLSDLELLARLQHYGAATCLIDFTHNPLVALWFACREQPEHDGKVVVVDTGADATIPGLSEGAQLQSRFRIVTREQIENKIEEFLDGETPWKWEPTPRESRVIAQQSIFVFGQAMIRMDERCGTVCIPTSAKKNILRALHEKFGISEQSLFGDFAGFALANAHDKSYEEYSADDYYEFARSYYQSDDKAKVIEYCGKVIRKDRKHRDAYHLRGICNDDLGNWSESIKDFNEAIKIDAKRAISFFWRGWVYEYRLQELQKGIDDYTKAIDLVSNNEGSLSRLSLANAYFRRGHTRANLNDHPNAIVDFASAIESIPENSPYMANILFGRAKSYRALGNESAAQADENKANEINQPKIKQAIPTQ